MVVLALVVFPINILAALAAFPPLAALAAPLATPAVAADIAKVPAIDPFILKAPASVVGEAEKPGLILGLPQLVGRRLLIRLKFYQE